MSTRAIFTGTKTKLVVLNENTLGYIDSEYPHYVGILQASIIKSSRFRTNGGYQIFYNSDNIRYACEEDFATFRCFFGGFDNKEQYEYVENGEIVKLETEEYVC